MARQSEGRRVGIMGDHIELLDKGDRVVSACVECGHEYGSAGPDPKQYAVVAEGPITEASALNVYGAVDEVVLRYFYCPGCGVQIGVSVQRREDPPYADSTLHLVD